jgi:hypothetical protein
MEAWGLPPLDNAGDDASTETISLGAVLPERARRKLTATAAWLTLAVSGPGMAVALRAPNRWAETKKGWPALPPAGVSVLEGSEGQ